MPKSVTFTRSPASTMMLAGLMSRWTTLLLCAKSSASATWAARLAARSTGTRPGAGDHALQADAVDELHGEVAHPVGLADVVDGDDVRVLELGRDLRLALEAIDQLVHARPGRGQPLEADGLDGHHAAQDLVLGLVHGAEGARAQLLDDQVPPGDLRRLRDRSALCSLNSGFLQPQPAASPACGRRPGADGCGRRCSPRPRRS